MGGCVLVGCGEGALWYCGHGVRREVCVEGREVAHLAGMSGLLWVLLYLCVLLYLLLLLGRLRRLGRGDRGDWRERDCVCPILR